MYVQVKSDEWCNSGRKQKGKTCTETKGKASCFAMFRVPEMIAQAVPDVESRPVALHSQTAWPHLVL
jgi:hypothetical protein